MNTKERFHQLIDDLPEGLVTELERYARYLSWLREQEDWERFTLSMLDSRYGPDEVEYSLADGRARPQ